jgi:hypothetical protein
MHMRPVLVLPLVRPPLTRRVLLAVTRKNAAVTDDIGHAALAREHALSEPLGKGMRVEAARGIMGKIPGADHKAAVTRVVIAPTLLVPLVANRAVGKDRARARRGVDLT